MGVVVTSVLRESGKHGVVETDPCKDKDSGKALYSLVQCGGHFMFMMVRGEVARALSLYEGICLDSLYRTV